MLGIGGLRAIRVEVDVIQLERYYLPSFNHIISIS